MLLSAAAVLAAPAGVHANRRPAGDVAIFYYPWFGTVRRDGAWRHWQQGGARPPARIGSAFYPARGVYSSDDPAVVEAQMEEIARAGVRTVVVSWWGKGSVEDARLPAVAAAARAHGLRVAAHLEPYPGRTAASAGEDAVYLRGLGISDVYVYDSTAIADADWRAVNAALTGVRLFANTALPGRAKAGGFAGLYTYDVLVYDGSSFRRMCASARRLGLVCAPSVGPGFDSRRAAGDPRVQPRLGGRTYDRMWGAAVRAGADVVTITSYNEWAEGTQIEPAAAVAGYESYEGAWATTGRAAEAAYLDRTAYWSARYLGR